MFWFYCCINILNFYFS